MNDPLPRQPHAMYAGFISRAVAFVIDAILVAALLAVTGNLLQLLIGFFGNIIVESWVSTLVIDTGVTGVAFVFQFVYFIFFWSVLGQTPGKMILGLRVVQTDGRRLGIMRAIARYFGYWVSALPLTLGYVWVLVNPRRSAWHDLLAGTAVVFTHDFGEYHQRVQSAHQRNRPEGSRK